MNTLFKIRNQKREGYNCNMKNPQLSKRDSYLQLGSEELNLSLVSEEEQLRLNQFADMERAFKQNQQISGLMKYEIQNESIKDISESDNIENQDALHLMRIIIGGYFDDDFATYLSYNDFQQKKQGFGVLKSIYQNIQKKYRNKKIEQSKLQFRSMLLMVYLQENISKLSRLRVEQIFSKNKIVW